MWRRADPDLQFVQAGVTGGVRPVDVDRAVLAAPDGGLAERGTVLAAAASRVRAPG